MRSIVYIILFLALASCWQNKEGRAKVDEDYSIKKYTCSMHPQIMRDEPGTCPICGMDLVPLNKATKNKIMLSDNQVRLANITTGKISVNETGQTIIVNGKLSVDETQSEVISSRAEGRIEKLYFKETGTSVKKGEPLYQLYSERLVTLQKEYLLAKEQAEVLRAEKFNSYVEAAAQKLLRYGLTKNQIGQLSKLRLLQERVTFVSPTNGIVTEINVGEGEFISEGAVLYRIENFNSLWVEAELYPQESALVKDDSEIEISISGFESEPIKAKVSFISPSYKANTQIQTIRATINNKNLKYKPGLQARIMLKHSSALALTVPTDAVIHDSKGTQVFVQTGTNTFQSRVVTTGIENADQVEIIAGLKEGEVIALTGAYLIYSDMTLKGYSVRTHTHD